MEQFLGKNAKKPYLDELNFIYCLGFQYSNESLINFIASKFNATDKATRNLQVYDWVYALKFILTRYKIYDDDVLVAFNKIYFNEYLDFDYNFEFWDKSLNYLESLENFDDIELVGNGKYVTKTIPEYTKEISAWLNKDQILEENRTDFFSFSIEQQQEILNVYTKYLEEESSIENSGPFVFETLREDAINGLINSQIYDNLFDEVSTYENKTLIYNVCKHFLQIQKLDSNVQDLDNEMIEMLTKGLFVESNMILTAYYLQYILMSLGVTFTKNLTKFGVNKIAGKQTDIMQRFLCSSTTQKWNVLNEKGNSYYKTVNNMFKLDKDIKGEKENVLKNLCKVRTMLQKGGFLEAIKILDEDTNRIRAYK